MNEQPFTFQVSNPLLLAFASLTASLSVIFSANIQRVFSSSTPAVAFSILMILASVILLAKGMRPIQFTLLPDGLRIDEEQLSLDQITHFEMNARYRRISLTTSGNNRPRTYYLKRKGDIPYVQQALTEWAAHTGINLEIKDHWT